MHKFCIFIKGTRLRSEFYLMDSQTVMLFQVLDRRLTILKHSHDRIQEKSILRIQGGREGIEGGREDQFSAV